MRLWKKDLEWLPYCFRVIKLNQKYLVQHSIHHEVPQHSHFSTLFKLREKLLHRILKTRKIGKNIAQKSWVSRVVQYPCWKGHTYTCISIKNDLCNATICDRFCVQRLMRRLQRFATIASFYQQFYNAMFRRNHLVRRESGGPTKTSN